MKVSVTRTRMAMNGEFYAYDVRVPVSECPWINPCDVITSCSTEGRFYSFEDATLPREHWAREKGWDRYQDRLEHEARVKPIMLALTRVVFPEVEKGMAHWADLWVEIPGFDASHDTRMASYGGN